MLPVAARENYLYSIDGSDFRAVHHTFHSEHIAQNAAYIAPCYHMERRGGRCAAAAAQNGGGYEVATCAIVKNFTAETTLAAQMVGRCQRNHAEFKRHGIQFQRIGSQLLGTHIVRLLISCLHVGKTLERHIFRSESITEIHQCQLTGGQCGVGALKAIEQRAVTRRIHVDLHLDGIDVEVLCADAKGSRTQEQ